MRRWGLIIGIGMLVGLLALAGLATVALAQGPDNSGQQGWSGPGMMGGRGGPSTSSGHGMMDGWRGNWDNTLDSWSDSVRRGWNGMMGGWGHGGMMGGYGGMNPETCHGDWSNPGTGEPLTLDEATQRVHEYVDSLGNPDLVLAEVMEFENNFYKCAVNSNQGSVSGNQRRLEPV